MGGSPYLLGLGTQGVVGDAPHFPVLHTREPGSLRGPGEWGAVGSRWSVLLWRHARGPADSTESPVGWLLACHVLLTRPLPTAPAGRRCVQPTLTRGTCGSEKLGAGPVHTQAPDLGLRGCSAEPRARGPRLGSHPLAGPPLPLLDTGCAAPRSSDGPCLERVGARVQQGLSAQISRSLTPLLTVAIV